MNLHQVASGVVSAVNPARPASIQISAGYSTAPTGKRTPAYETPGAFTASIVAGLMDVTAIAAGVLRVGQTITGPGVAVGTRISALGTGTGGLGTYQVAPSQDAASAAMTSALLVSAQVQALTYKDLVQIDGLNLNGERRAIYLYGDIQGVVRADNKGGDLITMMDDGTVWLVAQALETWPGWCKVAVTLQT